MSKSLSSSIVCWKSLNEKRASNSSSASVTLPTHKLSRMVSKTNENKMFWTLKIRCVRKTAPVLRQRWTMIRLLLTHGLLSKSLLSQGGMPSRTIILPWEDDWSVYSWEWATRWWRGFALARDWPRSESGSITMESTLGKTWKSELMRISNKRKIQDLLMNQRFRMTFLMSNSASISTRVLFLKPSRSCHLSSRRTSHRS